jgi:hypothetical protein
MIAPVLALVAQAAAVRATSASIAVILPIAVFRFR